MKIKHFDYWTIVSTIEQIFPHSLRERLPLSPPLTPSSKHFTVLTGTDPLLPHSACADPADREGPILSSR